MTKTTNSTTNNTKATKVVKEKSPEALKREAKKEADKEHMRKCIQEQVQAAVALTIAMVRELAENKGLTVTNPKDKEVMVLELKDLEKALSKTDFADKLGSVLWQTAPSKRRPFKDPKAPKKNVTSYMCATKQWRDELKKSNPKTTAPEITKLMGAKWKSLADDEKKPFENLAKADKVRYEKEMASYKAPSDEELAKLAENQPKKKRGLGKAKRVVHPDMPKRPKTAFALYSDATKEETHARLVKVAKKAAKKIGGEPVEVKGKQVAETIREAWKALKEASKEEGKDGGEYTDELTQYTDPAEEALEAYKAAHKAFLETNPAVAAELQAVKEEAARKRAEEKKVKAEAKRILKETEEVKESKKSKRKVVEEPASDDEEDAGQAEESSDSDEAESSEDSDEE